MKHSKSDSVYCMSRKKENSKKGGNLESNGTLENSDFLGKNQENRNRNRNRKNQEFELQEIRNRKNQEFKLQENKKVNSIKRMIQKSTNNPYIFFGYNPDRRTYKYVFYEDISNSPVLIKCHKLQFEEDDNNSELVELNYEDIIKIETEELIILFYQFLLIRKENPNYMNNLFKYLCDVVLPKIEQVHFSNNNIFKTYKILVEEIKKMLKINGTKRHGKNEKAKLNNQTIGLPKEIRKGLLNEPYILFGYNPSTGTYRYVCYNNPNIFSKTPVIFKSLDDNGNPVKKLSFNEIKSISYNILLELFNFLDTKSFNRKNGTQYMHKLQTFLMRDIDINIPNNYLTK
jgi:hypothetical protein